MGVHVIDNELSHCVTRITNDWVDVSGTRYIHAMETSTDVDEPYGPILLWRECSKPTVG